MLSPETKQNKKRAKKQYIFVDAKLIYAEAEASESQRGKDMKNKKPTDRSQPRALVAQHPRKDANYGLNFSAPVRLTRC